MKAYTSHGRFAYWLTLPAPRDEEPCAQQRDDHEDGRPRQRDPHAQAHDQLPDPAQWDPTPEEAGALRDRLLKAGEQRLAPAQQA